MGAAGLRGARTRRGQGGEQIPSRGGDASGQLSENGALRQPEIPGNDRVSRVRPWEECSQRYVCTAHQHREGAINLISPPLDRRAGVAIWAFLGTRLSQRWGLGGLRARATYLNHASLCVVHPEMRWEQRSVGIGGANKG